ncbi:hypothetical protein [Pontixanthobacter gangjinensis]|uniref:Uncharacterized protein n=1 Tax=Pontixanthobacter gangjinensis TaxID=1028742 RepID=A0A6I4SM63_9SPHN|nr:hypothetical protein [Pontixanthobacter gangjinensis]MXO56809.1 hypothetical protein [Pontixanthobacter gangjinensis]
MQADLRHADTNGGPGVIISGLAWFAAIDDYLPIGGLLAAVVRITEIVTGVALMAKALKA